MSQRYGGRVELSIAELERLRRCFRRQSDPNLPSDRDIYEWLGVQIDAKRRLAEVRAKAGYDEWGAKL
jgi:hypothetical protein